LRYIGKGSGDRLRHHVIEANRINSRRARGANTDATSTKFYRLLAEAIREGAVVTEEITHSNLTNTESYRIEKQLIEQMYAQNPDHLWNSVDERFFGITSADYNRISKYDLLQKARNNLLNARSQLRR
jgi:hypothetical protein